MLNRLTHPPKAEGLADNGLAAGREAMSVNGFLCFLFQDGAGGRRVAPPDYAAPQVAVQGLAYDPTLVVQLGWQLDFMTEEVEGLGIGALCLLNDWSYRHRTQDLAGHPDPSDPASPFWSDSRHCHPPEAVAAAADRLIGAVKGGDRNATAIVGIYRVEMAGSQEEAEEAVIRDMTWIRDTCRHGCSEGLSLVSMLAD